MIDALPLLLSDEGYQISRSVRLRSGASAFFNRTPGSASNRNTWTWSSWVKRGTLGSGQTIFVAYPSSTVYAYLAFTSSDQIRYASTNSGANLITTAVYRDPSAWYHIVFVYDDTQATSSNRLKLYVNGVQITAFGTAAYPTLNFGDYVNSANVHNIGRFPSGVEYVDGYLTEINFIDGQALTPSSFGETNAVTGVWQPKKYAGTYGTNGFYLNFSDNSAATAAAIGKDYSGNGNNWTPNNISVTAGVTYDSMLDVPTQWADGGNGRGNYSTLNPLSKDASGTVLDGNLGFTASAIQSVTSTIAYPSSGKWYCEFQITTTPDNSVFELVGLTTANAASNVTRAYASNGQYYNGSAFVAFGSAWAINDVIGIAADIDNSQVSFYKNGTLQGSTQTFAFPADYAPMMRARNTGTSTFNANFGQRPFAYTPPSGFRALNTLNLPTPTILKGNQYFDATTYAGTGASQTVGNGGGFAPDFVWTKSRSGAYDHFLLDSVRGGSALLISNSTSAEFTGTTYISSFAGSGFTIANTSSTGINASGSTYVGWQWKEGATQGFDIVTGTSPASGNFNVSHSLGVAPAMIILKDRTNAGTAWGVWHRSLANPAQSFLQLNNTNAVAANANIWGNTAPTSTQFTTQSGQVVLGSANYVAYLFAAVAGYSAFGSYLGNGSTDGPFIFTGFRPKWIMWKKTNSATNAPWVIVDTSRSPYNLAREYLLPNASDAETSVDLIDVLSNGFKWRGTAPGGNASGDTYIYAAFSEFPFKNSLAR